MAQHTQESGTLDYVFTMRMTREENRLIRQRAARLNTTRTTIVRGGLDRAIAAERAHVQKVRAGDRGQ